MPCGCERERNKRVTRIYMKGSGFVCLQLHLVSENVKYLLELMQNQRSDFLEWIIIILIAAEIMVSLFDMFHKIS